MGYNPMVEVLNDKTNRSYTAEFKQKTDALVTEQYGASLNADERAKLLRLIKEKSAKDGREILKRPAPFYQRKSSNL